MKYITLVTTALLFYFTTFSQINNETQKAETVRWINEKLKEARPEAKVTGPFTEFFLSNFDNCKYIIREITYMKVKGETKRVKNNIVVFSLAECKQELMMKFVDKGLVNFNILVDADDNSIQETKMDENNVGISRQRLTTVDIGPFKNDPVLIEKVKKAIQSLYSYCKSRGSNSSSVNKNIIVDWLNQRINLANKIPVQVQEGELLKTSYASKFDRCSYTIFSDLWQFKKDYTGSIGITKETAQMDMLDASTLTLFIEDGRAWFIVMTKMQKKTIPLYRCDKESRVTGLESYGNTIRFGPFLDDLNTKEIAEKYLKQLIEGCAAGA